MIAALALLTVLAGCSDDGARLHIDGDTFYYDPDDAFDYESYFAELRERSLPDSETAADTRSLLTTAPEDTEAVQVVTDTVQADDTSAVIVTEAIETAPSVETAQLPETDTVYWVKNGEVWHVSAKCSTLSRSKEILSGTVEAAKESGKERVCKRCGK